MSSMRTSRLTRSLKYGADAWETIFSMSLTFVNSKPTMSMM